MATFAFYGEPRAPRLFKLLEEVRRGEIRVPRFQRPFLWTDEQRLTLLDIIYSGFPIGSFLVWRTREHRLSTYERLGPMRLPPQADEDVTRQYLLDGHQRLVTLFTALGPGLPGREDDDERTWSPADEEERTRWPIYFDLQSDIDERRESSPFRLPRRHEEPPSAWLPLDKLFDSYALLDFEDKLKKDGYGRDMVNRVRSIADAFRDYTIPVIPIASEDLARVTMSFKRANSGGTTPLGEAHMMRAVVHNPRFDLLERLDELTTELKPVGWSRLDPQIVLTLCKMRLPLLFEEEPENLARKLDASPDLLNGVRDDILHMARIFDAIAGVLGPQSVPASDQAVLLANALHGLDAVSGEAMRELRIWFWSTTLSDYFRGMPRALFEQARAHLHQLVRGSGPPHPPGMVSVIEPIGRFDFRGARARGLALLLAEKGASSLDERRGSPFELLADHGREALSAMISARDVDLSDHELVHSVGNQFLVHPRSVDALRALKHGTSLRHGPLALEDHLIGLKARETLWRKDWAAFLRLRRHAVEALERARAEECGLSYQTRG